MNRGVEGGAVLITGVYGSGKSSVAQEIADLLEEQNAPYALMDLDFLGWFDAAGEGGPAEQSVMLKNLSALVGNYLAVGVRFFVLAGAIRDGAELDDLKAALTMPLRVIRLSVPLAEIEKRLRSDPTRGRRADLREAAAWVAGSVGVGSRTRRSRTSVLSARWRRRSWVGSGGETLPERERQGLCELLRERRLGEVVRRIPLPRTPVNEFPLNAPNVCRWHHAHSVDPI